MNDTSRDQHADQLPADPPHTGVNQPPASSYTSEGPGWWQASDHKWYPPQHHPDYVAPPTRSPVSPPSPYQRPSGGSPSTASPSAWDTIRPHVDKARPHVETGRRFFTGLSRERKIMLGGAAALAVVTTIAAPLTAYHYFFAGPSLPPEQQFVRDVAAAGIVSADPAVKAGINLPASADSTATIISLATTVCADLNNGTSRDAEAMQLYQGALEGTLTGGAPLPHVNAVKIVNLAVQDVCPGR
jgi:Protein of unknown function (DUF732)